jgi:hypothetical protein
LLAHCGGGQDKPGCLGPSAKLPRHFFLSGFFSRSSFRNFRTSTPSLAGKRRLKLSRSNLRQRAESPAEFAYAQPPLTAQPADKILGLTFALQ